MSMILRGCRRGKVLHVTWCRINSIMPEVLSLYEVQFVKKFGTQKLKKSGAQWLHGVVGGGVCCNTSRSNQFFQVQLIIRSPVACSARDSSKAELSPKFYFNCASTIDQTVQASQSADSSHHLTTVWASLEVFACPLITWVFLYLQIFWESEEPTKSHSVTKPLVDRVLFCQNVWGDLNHAGKSSTFKTTPFTSSAVTSHVSEIV